MVDTTPRTAESDARAIVSDELQIKHGQAGAEGRLQADIQVVNKQGFDYAKQVFALEKSAKDAPHLVTLQDQQLVAEKPTAREIAQRASANEKASQRRLDENDILKKKFGLALNNNDDLVITNTALAKENGILADGTFDGSNGQSKPIAYAYKGIATRIEANDPQTKPYYDNRISAIERDSNIVMEVNDSRVHGC